MNEIKSDETPEGVLGRGMSGQVKKATVIVEGEEVKVAVKRFEGAQNYSSGIQEVLFT